MKKIAKRLFHKFFIDENGAVSIYLVLVSLCLFFFSAVLIDYARIMVAERQTERALQSGLRTMMSDIDSDVYKYALFGRNFQGDAEAAKFEEAVEKNLLPTDDTSEEYFQFTDVKLEDAIYNYDTSRNLANEDIFKHQIVDDMKYRAPIELTLEIIEGFTKVTEGMEQASILNNVASKLDREAESRQDDLRKLNNYLKESQSELSWIGNNFNDTASNFPYVDDLEDIVRHLETYQQIIEDSKNEDDGEDSGDDSENEPEYTMEDAQKFKENARLFILELITRAELANAKADDAKDSLNDAKKHNDEMKKIIETEKRNADANYSDAKDFFNEHGGGPDPEVDGAVGGIDASINKLEEYIMPDSYFTTMEQYITKAKDEYGNEEKTGTFRFALGGLLAFIEFSLETNSKSNLEALRSLVKLQHSKVKVQIDGAVKYFSDNPGKYEKQESKEKRNEANDQLKDNKKNMDDWKKEAEDFVYDEAQYLKLLEKVQKYNGFDDAAASDIPMDDIRDTTDETMSIVDGLFKKLGELLKSGRNELYFNEYVLTRFNSHNFKLPRDERFRLKNNEAEYIIYGFPNTHLNYSAALTELFLMRLAINFVEAFISIELKLPGPALLWQAFIYALKETGKDMTAITKGLPIYFFGNFNFQTDYKDYLRLFLLLHSEGSVPQRTMALVDLNSYEKDLTTLPTVAEGEITSSVDLWFIPTIADMLSKMNVLDGHVEDGRFIINRKAFYSY